MSSHPYFSVARLEVIYNPILKFNSIHNVIIPSSNIAGSILRLRGVSADDSSLFSANTPYDWEQGYTCHQIAGNECIILAFNQPYMLTSFRLRLWDLDTRRYSYNVEVSVDNENWEMVANRTEIVTVRPPGPNDNIQPNGQLQANAATSQNNNANSATTASSSNNPRPINRSQSNSISINSNRSNQNNNPSNRAATPTTDNTMETGEMSPGEVPNLETENLSDHSQDENDMNVTNNLTSQIPNQESMNRQVSQSSQGSQTASVNGGSGSIRGSQPSNNGFHINSTTNSSSTINHLNPNPTSTSNRDSTRDSTLNRDPTAQDRPQPTFQRTNQNGQIIEKRLILCTSWQTIHFKQRPVCFVKITGTRNTVNEVFHLVYFEAPAAKYDSSRSDVGHHHTSGMNTPSASSHPNNPNPHLHLPHQMGHGHLNPMNMGNWNGLVNNMNPMNMNSNRNNNAASDQINLETALVDPFNGAEENLEIHHNRMPLDVDSLSSEQKEALGLEV